MQKKPKAAAAGTVKKHANDNGKYSPTPTPEKIHKRYKQKPTERRTGNNPTPQRYTSGKSKKPTERRTGNNPIPKRYANGISKKPTERRTGNNPAPQRYTNGISKKTYRTPHEKQPYPPPKRYANDISKKPTERRMVNNPAPQRYTNGISINLPNAARQTTLPQKRYANGKSKKPTERRTGNNPAPQRYTNGISKKNYRNTTAYFAPPICKKNKPPRNFFARRFIPTRSNVSLFIHTPTRQAMRLRKRRTAFAILRAEKPLPRKLLPRRANTSA